MLQKMLSLSILLIILGGCKTASYNKSFTIDLPDMPIAGSKVADELIKICVPATKCENLNLWLNELYSFKVKYQVYKDCLK